MNKEQEKKAISCLSRILFNEQTAEDMEYLKQFPEAEIKLLIGVVSGPSIGGKGKWQPSNEDGYERNGKYYGKR